jgi:uncharacterized protein (TIGR02145 family)
MKTKILLTFLMILMIVGAMAQRPSLTLAFAADVNGQYLQLNSILIENLTQGGDTTLYAPDTILVLDYFTGMEEVNAYSGNGFYLFQNYPNPMTGKTTIGLRLPERDNVMVTVSDMMAREVVNHVVQLEQGSHFFTFYPGRERVYFLTVQAHDQIQTIKMFNDLSHSFGPGTFKLEYSGLQQTGGENYKSEKALNNFVFNMGDMLKFTSFTSLGERVITSTPAGDMTYYFHYTGEPCPGMPTVTDMDGNVYNTVQVGTQCWMRENLKTTSYSNGTSIPNVTETSVWTTLSSGAYVWYDNTIGWKDIYGALYNWFTTVDINGLCPTGWHVPSDDEWRVLTDFLGGIDAPHGNELKSCRQEDSPLEGGCSTSEHPRWSEASNWGTDDYGFSALPSGYRGYNGAFLSVGTNTHWWSSTDYQSTHAYGRNLYSTSGAMGEYGGNKKGGFAIRCLKD